MNSVSELYSVPRLPWRSATAIVTLLLSAGVGACGPKRSAKVPLPGPPEARAAVVLSPVKPAIAERSQLGVGALTDSAISEAVNLRLRRDPGVGPLAVAVQTTDGIVELRGTMPDLLSKERVVRIAETTRGVRAVSDRLIVRAVEVPDGALRKQVEEALRVNATTEAFDIAVEAEAARITLNGSVQSWPEMQAAERVAKGVRGVGAVSNRIRIQYTAKRSDAELARDVESRLHWDVLVDDSRIIVHVQDGHVRLAGAVASAAARARAEFDAWVSNARTVDASALIVDPALAKELRQSRYAPRSDAQIADAIRDAVTVDPRVRSAGLRVEVAAGIATLRGTVASLAAKLAAGSLAEHTVGVVLVRNLTDVRTTGKNAESATERIQTALRLHPALHTRDIEAVVKKGRVTLTGTVQSYFESAQAADVVSRVRGVSEVVNRLEVSRRSPGYVYRPYVDSFGPYVASGKQLPSKANFSDAEIVRRIRHEMRWTPYVDQREVDVYVSDGVAILTGTVDSAFERSAAEHNALQGGAIAVDNELEVERP